MHKKNYAQNIIRTWINNDELLYKQTIGQIERFSNPTAFAETILYSIEDFMLFECGMDSEDSFSGLTDELLNHVTGEADVYELAEKLWIDYATEEQKKEFFTAKWEN